MILNMMLKSGLTTLPVVRNTFSIHTILMVLVISQLTSMQWRYSKRSKRTITTLGPYIHTLYSCEVWPNEQGKKYFQCRLLSIMCILHLQVTPAALSWPEVVNYVNKDSTCRTLVSLFRILDNWRDKVTWSLFNIFITGLNIECAVKC